MAARSVARPISPPSASISLTRCPFAVPPTAGLQDICPMASRFMVKSRVGQPRRAAARAASSPAWPAPMTITSNSGIALLHNREPTVLQRMGGHRREGRGTRGAWQLQCARGSPTIGPVARALALWRRRTLVEFGFSLPGRGPLARPDLLLRIARRAEALRYDSLFVTDHVVLPASSARSVYPYSPTGKLAGGAAQDYLEPFSLLAYLAHATARI